MADAGSNWSEWVNGGDEPRLELDTEKWYKSAGGARRFDLDATCYVTTCANGKKYETWVAKGVIDDHACSEKEGFGDTLFGRAEAFKEADAYELARPKDDWGDWMSYIPIRERATACQSKCNLFRLSLDYMPRGHPRRQHVEQCATALMTKAATDVYGDKPIKLRLCRAVCGRIDEHIRQFCKPDICKRVGLRALAKFMDLDIKSIHALLDKDAYAFKMVLGAMVCLILKPDAADADEDADPDDDEDADPDDDEDADADDDADADAADGGEGSASKHTDERPDDVTLTPAYLQNLDLLEELGVVQAAALDKAFAEKCFGDAAPSVAKGRPAAATTRAAVARAVAARVVENPKTDPVKLTQGDDLLSKEDLLQLLTTSDVELVSKALCMPDQAYASTAVSGKEKEQLKETQLVRFSVTGLPFDSEHPAFLPRKDGERLYVYPNQAWEKRVSHSYEFFTTYRTGRDSRSADMQSISDWPMPLPFQLGADNSWLPEHFPSFVMEHLSHKRNFAAQLIMIELRGALGWFDQQFHPFASWTQYLSQLMRRQEYLARHQTAPRSCTSTYKKAMRQLRMCASAVENNEPEVFRRYMGIFSEKAFADELHAHNCKDSCLSTQLGEMLVCMRDGSIGTDSFELWVPNTDVVDERFQNMFHLPLSASDERNTEIQSRWPKLWTWMVIINELTAKMDHVAVLVVDSLCIGISSHLPPHHDPCFGKMVFHPGFKFALRAATVNKFTDTTAPTYYFPHWNSYPEGHMILSMEAASRKVTSARPRARFPDTLYAAMVLHGVHMYDLFLKRYKVNLDDSTGHIKCMHSLNADTRHLKVFKEALEMHQQFKNIIDHCHFGTWSRKEKLVAACALIKYAQDQRKTMDAHQEAKLKEPVPTAHSFGVYSLRKEIYVNLDTASMLIDLVMASCNKDNDHCVYGEHAFTCGIELHNVKQAWLVKDAAFDRRVANAEKEGRKRQARLARERESAVAATVHLCASRACTAVVMRARASDLKAKIFENNRMQSLREHRLVQLEREARARARISLHFSWAPRIVRRKAAHVQLVADNKAQKAREAVDELARAQERARSVSVAVELNRAAAVRREAALAQRAEGAKEAIAREAKEAKRAIARDAKDEKRARASQRKAEQDERTARVQAQVEADEHARRAREAAEKAEVVARARIAEVEKARAREEAREARKREATRVAEEQRRRDEDEALQNELKRRAAQSKADRKLENTLVKQKRAMLAAAFPQWREAAAAVKMARSVHKLRCAEQQRCNAIIREGLKKKADNKAEARARREEKVLQEREARVQADKAAKEALATEKAKVEAAAEKAAPAPKEFTEADVNHASSVSFARGEQWDADYRHELAVARMASQNAWVTETGWATNRRVWYAMGGNALVQQQLVAQQQQDVFAATFQANCKYMERIRHLEQKSAKEGLAHKWTICVQEHADKMAALDYEQKRLLELEAEISEVETQKEERLTRYAVLREYLDGLEAATEAERRQLSAQRCEQLRKRTEGSYDVSLAVNECVLCMSEPCSHIAAGCFHVIGCEACIVQHRNCHGNFCPICKEPTTFQKMHFP